MHATELRDRTRVVVVEDHALFADALDLALTTAGYAVRCEVTGPDDDSARAVLAAIIRHRPRVVLLDLNLGSRIDGGQLIRPLARHGIAVVVLTASSDRGRWGECLEAGARTVLSKELYLREVVSTIRRIDHGQAVLGREERESLVRLAHNQEHAVGETKVRLDRLTNREAEILAHLMRGRTVHDIAQLGVVADATVRTQVKAVLAKLEVSSQLAAVAAAFGASWQPPDLTRGRRSRTTAHSAPEPVRTVLRPER